MSLSLGTEVRFLFSHLLNKVTLLTVATEKDKKRRELMKQRTGGVHS